MSACMAIQSEKSRSCVSWPSRGGHDAMLLETVFAFVAPMGSTNRSDALETAIRKEVKYREEFVIRK